MPLAHTSLADQAADALTARIVSGEWPIGTTLPGEHALATELGVGRSTVREAVRSLGIRGLVVARQGSGVFVRATTPATDWDDLLRRTRAADVVEARVAIEVQAARLAATRRTPADLDALQAALEARATAERPPELADPDAGAHDAGAHETVPPDDAAYVDADAAFHAAVVSASHNPVLVELFAACAPRVRAATLDVLALAGPGSPHHHDQDLHTAILDAVDAGEPDAAGRAARVHLQSILDALADEDATTEKEHR